MSRADEREQDTWVCRNPANLSHQGNAYRFESPAIVGWQGQRPVARSVTVAECNRNGLGTSALAVFLIFFSSRRDLAAVARWASTVPRQPELLMLRIKSRGQSSWTVSKAFEIVPHVELKALAICLTGTVCFE